MQDVDTAFQSPVTLSLCTGMRGIERGLERVGIYPRIAAYVEIEAFVIYNLVAQMEQGVVAAAPVWTDVKTFDAKPFRNKIHGIIAGYPCQPFSVAGDMLGADDPRHLYPHIERIVETARPIWALFENVANHLNEGFDVVQESLRNLGYSVEAGLYSAAEIGATHERSRLFILALDNTHRKRWREKPASGFQAKVRALHQKSLRQNLHNQTNRPSDDVHFPSRPGEPQKLWEESRVVKPGMGCTIDGYNFKTDLLRMYGNGVVEHTAEKAIIDLLYKHLIL